MLFLRYVFPIARGSHFQKLTNERQAHPNVDQSHQWKFPKVPNVSKSHRVRRLEKKLIESNTRLLRNEKYIYYFPGVIDDDIYRYYFFDL